MRKYVIILLVVALMAFATQGFAEYDKDKVKQAMRANGSNMGALKKAAEAGDFFTAAERLMDIAKTMKSLEDVTPKKGDKKDWDDNHQALIKAALKGIGTCGAEDREALNGYIGEIGGLIKQGHSMFK